MINKNYNDRIDITIKKYSKSKFHKRKKNRKSENL